jgi:uncharacterized phage-like protein YoqJ
VIVAATGHRPDKIGGYEWEAPQRVWVRQQIKQALIELRPTKGISGMALGVDQDFAYVCTTLGILFTAALPFVGQESRWPAHSQKFYDWLLERADDVVVVSPGDYAPWKMQRRNEWMVNHCDILLAVWDGSDGGTGNCVKYAERLLGPALSASRIRRIDPTEFFREGP